MIRGGRPERCAQRAACRRPAKPSGRITGTHRPLGSPRRRRRPVVRAPGLRPGGSPSARGALPPAIPSAGITRGGMGLRPFRRLRRDGHVRSLAGSAVWSAAHRLARSPRARAGRGGDGQPRRRGFRMRCPGREARRPLARGTAGDPGQWGATGSAAPPSPRSPPSRLAARPGRGTVPTRCRARGDRETSREDSRPRRAIIFAMAGIARAEK